MSYNLNSGYGRALANALHGVIPTFGRVFIVVDIDDAGEDKYNRMQELFQPDRAGQVRFFTDLKSAYDATTSNNNDIILLDADGTHDLDAGMLTVSKNRVHFIGMDGGDRLIQQGAKIQLGDNTADAAATISVSGTRCSFRNLKILNGGTHANSVSAVIGEGDEGTLWKNCSFQKTSDLDQAAVSNFECRSDSATFIDCEFGFDTLTISAARPNFLLKASGATRAKNLRMRDCTFTVASTEATAQHIKVATTASLNFTNVFKDCVFLNSLVGSAAALNDAVTSVSSLVEGSMLFINPASEASEFCSAVTDQVKVIGPGMDGTNPAQKIGIALTPA
jgi:hypothetical protein